ncbi:MAG: TonB-dependent receptor [Colwellia sp.]|nr:TonB-dependent receptor [Colwellia sp.]
MKVKVTVASLSEETLLETPVPVTLITEQIIKQSGALTLKELLITYVPGFTDIEDQNEINVAARGIYTSAQQKILILINGHRLNSRSYSMAAPDFGISLDKIKQIEVLRGPASSLYGNVSLTATINIILKEAKDNQQLSIKALIGNYGQQGLSLNFGHQFDSFDLFAWASLYKSDGEKIYLNQNEVYTAEPAADNQAILNAHQDKSPYDIGFNISNSEFHFLFNSHASHYTEPFSGGGLTGEPYKYQEYDKFSGYGAGLGYIMNHLEYGRKFHLGKWLNETRVYWDDSEIIVPLIIDPSQKLYGAPQWKDQSLGFLSTFETTFSFGTLLTGIQIEGYKVYGSEFPLTVGQPAIQSEVEDMLPSGSESNSSVFLQYKQQLSHSWYTNLGLRYDYKNRKATDNIQEVSPRLALIYTQGQTNLKISYSQSFVDATYWNRFSNLASFKGAKTLKPEKLRSLQVSPSFSLPDLNLQLTTNLFYDQAIDVIYRDNSATTNNYSNAGKLDSWGIEQEVTYFDNDLQIRINAAYRQALNSELIKKDQGYIENIPALTANLIIDNKITKNLALNLTFRYVGKQYSPIIIQHNGIKIPDPFPNSGVSFNDPNNYIDAALLVNSNINYQLKENMSINFKINNLFDQQHQQGGSTLHPYQKPGRWYYIAAEIQY